MALVGSCFFLKNQDLEKDRIGCRKPVYNIKMQVNDRKAIEKYIGIFNALAKDDMQERNSGNILTDEREFLL